jgi:predicted Zn finger-like uncharacterized protein
MEAQQLATRCPHCQTSFRVTMQQLELREGMVRCGTCREIFNGIDTVFEYEPDQDFALTPPPAGQDIADRMTLIDFGSLRGTQAPSPSNMQAELDALSRAIADLQAKPWAKPAGSPQEELGSPMHPAAGHDEDDAELAHDPKNGLPPLHADERPRHHGGDRDARDDGDPMDEIREPAFVQQGHQRERRARLWKILLWIAIPLLLLALAAQLAFYFRNEIAARSPQAAPYLRAACNHIGCLIKLPMEIDQLSLMSSRLDAIGEGSGRFQLTALIRNQGDTVQALPTLDLQMKNEEGRPLVRKAFLPTLYATKDEITNGLPAHSEREVHILFDLAGDPPAGFDLTLFYH